MNFSPVDVLSATPPLHLNPASSIKPNNAVVRRVDLFICAPLPFSSPPVTSPEPPRHHSSHPRPRRRRHHRCRHRRRCDFVRTLAAMSKGRSENLVLVKDFPVKEAPDFDTFRVPEARSARTHPPTSQPSALTPNAHTACRTRVRRRRRWIRTVGAAWWTRWRATACRKTTPSLSRCSNQPKSGPLPPPPHLATGSRTPFCHAAPFTLWRSAPPACSGSPGTPIGSAVGLPSDSRAPRRHRHAIQ